MPAHGAHRRARGDRQQSGSPTSTSSTSTTRKPQQGKGKLGSLENPEVYDNVPGHLIPTIEREFDDFDTEAGQLPARRAVRGAVHRLPAQAGRLRPAPARRADDPREAADGRGHPRPDRRVRLGDREVRAARQGSRHHPPEHPDPPRPAARRREADPRALRRRPLLARGLRQHGPQRHRRPLRRRQRGRAVRHHPLRGGLRPLLRPPPDDPADAAQGEDRVHGHRRGRRDHRHPRHRLHPARARRRPRGRDPGRRRHLDHAAGRPDPLRVRRARERRLPEGLRGRVPDLRPPGVAARQPRPRPDQGADRQDRHRRLPRDGRGGARGRLGRRARLLDRPPRLRDRRGGQRAGPPVVAASPNGDRSRVRPLPRGERPPAAPGGLQRGRGQDHPRRPDPRPAARARPDHARVHRRLGPHDRAPELRPALGPRRGRLRRLAAPRRARARRRRGRRDHRRRLLPRHRQLQARDHQLDGAQPGGPGAGRVDADRPIR